MNDWVKIGILMAIIILISVIGWYYNNICDETKTMYYIERNLGNSSQTETDWYSERGLSVIQNNYTILETKEVCK